MSFVSMLVKNEMMDKAEENGELLERMEDGGWRSVCLAAFTY